MIKVFAVDPNLFEEWNEFRYLHEKFGFSKARLISAFPKKWVQLVYGAASKFSPLQKKELELWLTTKSSFLVKSGIECIEPQDWLQSAEKALSRNEKAFSAILACENTRQHPKVISVRGQSIGENELFNCPHECFMPRTERGFTDIWDVLLEYSKEIILVDQYISSGHGKTRVVKALLQCIKGKKIETLSVVFPISSVGTEYENEKAHILSSFHELHSTITSKLNLSITFIVHDKQKDHNRFILTDMAGLKFPWGLDVTKKDSEDVVNLLHPNIHKKLFDEYKNLEKRELIEIVQLDTTV